MNIGFTGTQRGMTIEQKQCFWRFALDNFITVTVSGADKETHEIMI